MSLGDFLDGCPQEDDADDDGDPESREMVAPIDDQFFERNV